MGERASEGATRGLDAVRATINSLADKRIRRVVILIRCFFCNYSPAGSGRTKLLRKSFNFMLYL